ncbi:MAG: hypothetical protein ACR2HH_14735 [Chthoniobacterales bacterium]
MPSDISAAYNWHVSLARRLFLPLGEISRLRFLAFRLLLVALKLALDWFVTTVVFQQAWNPREYVWSKSPASRLTGTADRQFYLYLALLAVAAPFAWTGVCLCTQRLRTAGLPLWLVAFFFVPIAKWILFCMCLLMAAPLILVEACCGCLFAHFLTYHVGAIAPSAARPRSSFCPCSSSPMPKRLREDRAHSLPKFASPRRPRSFGNT